MSFIKVAALSYILLAIEEIDCDHMSKLCQVVFLHIVFLKFMDEIIPIMIQVRNRLGDEFYSRQLVLGVPDVILLKFTI